MWVSRFPPKETSSLCIIWQNWSSFVIYAKRKNIIYQSNIKDIIYLLCVQSAFTCYLLCIGCTHPWLFTWIFYWLYCIIAFFVTFVCTFLVFIIVFNMFYIVEINQMQVEIASKPLLISSEPAANIIKVRWNAFVALSKSTTISLFWVI